MKKIKTYFELEAGSVTTKIENGILKFLIIRRIKMNDYTLPKGHVEEGESLEETSSRETFEETGNQIRIKDFVDSFEYKVKEEKNGEEVYIIRRVYFYSAEVQGNPVEANNPDLKEGETIPIWVPYEKALENFTYETDKNVIKKFFISNNKLNHRN